ncbi:MAG TPA: HAMP domain-containing sensor histidine kinase [Gaiellaceae bacterium]|nr:HAMP domain-containing sensor histidine kinase [Gaiellaceae bacterium]
MAEHRSRASLRLRLLGAFVAVAAVATAAFAALTLWSARSDVNQLVRRQQQATSADVVAAVAAAYRGAGRWTLADLRPARAIAVSAGAVMEVRDAGGSLVFQGGRGMGPPGGTGTRGPGTAQLGAAFGAAQTRPVVVDGGTVGSVSLRFPKNALPPAERQLRDALTRTTVYGVLAAVVLALVVGFLVADGITRPIRRLIVAVQRLGRGDRSARANLQRAPGELGELAAAVDAMAATLEREDELRRALTADVAHELRTPVTILTAQCEAMIDGVTPASPEQLSSLHDEALRLGRVIDDLETLASAEAAGLRLERSRVDLGAVVEEAVALVRPQFETAEIELETNAEPAPVNGDEHRLMQVVRNLLINALKFTPAGGSVAVGVSCSDGVAELRVVDTGVGIVPEDVDHVFDRYWRGANGKTTSGSGIGLAVVRELVRAHDGTVAVSTEPGHGSTFTVRLPQASSPDARRRSSPVAVGESHSHPA